MKRNKISPLTLVLISFAFIGLAYTNCSTHGFQANLDGDDTASTDSALEPSTSSEDPFFKYAWHLSNTGQIVFAKEAGQAGNDLDLLGVWNQGLQGQGIRIMVSDDGVEANHEDLKGNFITDLVSKDYTTNSPYLVRTSQPRDANDMHSTSVAGLIAAVRNNGVGSAGVAPEAKFASANFVSDAVDQTDANYLDQATGNFDIFNMSWGVTQDDLSLPDADYESLLASRVKNGRSGKGVIYVKASGNDFAVHCHNSTTKVCIGNSNFDPDNTNPYMIVSTALDASGASASYASTGSNLWVSSFGGEYGDDSPAMMTTDRMGCDEGYAQTTVGVILPFDQGSNGNTNCNYTASFNGTSSAAPTVTGSIALILQANPNLTWRDVKYILAKTSKPMNDNGTTAIGHPQKLTLPTGYVWEQGWITNGAGFRFHNWYGFGKIDVAAAVALAKNYVSTLGTWTQSNWSPSMSIAKAIPDNAGLLVTFAVSQKIRIEAVQLKLNVTHPDVSELAVELTSPAGTKSILVNMRNSLTGIANFQGEVFLSNAFFQEDSQGTWGVKIIDGKTGNTGTLNSFSLNISGS
ncbi:MAG: serine protease [Bdellovibrio sp. CG10_big_fil_rev_8_21_14_0_10_47_8]|nr:MAG: serine protease [Bdellovibrio sp. CG10_big_fil_rev_8_21_14_0_10_47_8]